MSVINSKCEPTTLFVVTTLEGIVGPEFLSKPVASLQVIGWPDSLSNQIASLEVIGRLVSLSKPVASIDVIGGPDFLEVIGYQDSLS